MQGPFRAVLPLVLASASPRRQALLAGQGLCFAVQPSSCPEPAPEPHEEPAAYAARMASLKGQERALAHPDAVVISADTIVVLGTAILGKPRSTEQALEMLRTLAGTWHEVITGFCVLHQKRGKHVCRTVTTRVHMPVTPEEILRAYVATGEPMDKAGAYGIQGCGAFLVDEVQGSYTNVVGLPLRSVMDVLLDIQAVASFSG
ncbi:Maf family nucleotide pyrophosphatase [Desulfovibrionales bacterium]